MDPWRLATKAQRRINILAGLALASCVFAWLAGFGSAPIERVSASLENAGAKSIVARHEPSLVASTEPPVIPQATAVANAAIGDVEMATATQSAPEKATDTTASLDEPKSFVVASLTDPSQVFPPEEVATAPDTASVKAAAKGPKRIMVTAQTIVVDYPTRFTASCPGANRRRRASVPVRPAVWPIRDQ